MRHVATVVIRMGRMGLTGLMGFALTLTGPVTLPAETPARASSETAAAPDAMAQRIRQLEGRIRELERLYMDSATHSEAINRKVGEIEQVSFEQTARIEEIATEANGHASGLPEPLPDWVREIEIHGMVDAMYHHNLNTPDGPFQSSTFRIFDTETNTFNLEIAQLTFMKDPTEESRAGFRFDLTLGELAEEIESGGFFADDISVQQGYAAYLAPIGSGLTLQFGKFVTLIGAEVIEAPLNWNISRSYLFGLAIPFAHTGVLGSYSPNEHIDLALGAVNGWDNAIDGNDGKSALGRVGFNLGRLGLGFSGIWGPEVAGVEDEARWVADFVGTLSITDSWEIMVNADIGKEEGVFVIDPGGHLRMDLDGDGIGETPSSQIDVSWWGAAAYNRFQLTDRLHLVGRAEFFIDRHGTRTGTLVPTRMWEFTVTAGYEIAKNLMARVEFRHDRAEIDDKSLRVFGPESRLFTRNEGLVDTQETISGDVYFVF